MTGSTSLIVSPPPLPDVMTLGKVLAQSGYFSDAKEAGQAVVKVLAGQELGFGPIASMTGIYIVKGRVTLSANLMAAAIKRSGRYTYDVLEHTDKICTIQFSEGNKILGQSTFTKEDAAKAKLSGDAWSKYPRNMLFARALSNGAKWYTPDIFGGPIYTPDELGAVVDGETGEVLDNGPDWETTPNQDAEEDAKPESKAKPKPQPGPKSEIGKMAKAQMDHMLGSEAATNGRPLDAKAVRSTIRTKAKWQSDGLRLVSGEPVHEKQRGPLTRLLNTALPYPDGEMRDKLRHQVLDHLVGVNSSKDLMKLEASAMIDWLKVDEDGEWAINEYAQAEMANIVAAISAEGQGELAMEF